MRYTQVILLYFAGFILCLHCVMPHCHDGHLMSHDEIGLETADSFLDWVKTILLFDQGEGHLENFESAVADMDISSTALNPLIETIWTGPILNQLLKDQFHKKQIFKGNYLYPPDAHLRAISILRGPPHSFLG